MKEIHRVLKPGGILAITIRDQPREKSLGFTTESLQEWLLASKYQNVHIEKNGNPNHPLTCGLGEKF